MDNVLNSSRLKLARSRRGFSITELAKRVGLTTRMLSMYENGHRENPPLETLKKLSVALKYPMDFFSGDDLEQLEPSTVSFRSISRMKAKNRDAAIASGQIALIFNDWLESNFNLPSCDLDDLSGIEPEVAAMMIRQSWGLGNLSIKNLIHLLETKGIRIFSLFENNLEVDAFSFWKEKQPFIFLNSLKSSERSRFDAAHELGHLLLHKHGAPVGRECEQEADRFASAFLMPEESIKSLAVSFPSLTSIINLKKHWLVSAAALVRRLKDLNMITEWHYRSLNIEMSKRGYLKSEPQTIPREQSTILNMVLKNLWKDGISVDDISRELKISLDEIEALLFSLNNTTEFGSENKRMPDLRVV